MSIFSLEFFWSEIKIPLENKYHMFQYITSFHHSLNTKLVITSHSRKVSYGVFLPLYFTVGMVILGFYMQPPSFSKHVELTYYTKNYFVSFFPTKKGSDVSKFSFENSHTNIVCIIGILLISYRMISTYILSNQCNGGLKILPFECYSRRELKMLQQLDTWWFVLFYAPFSSY